MVFMEREPSTMGTTDVELAQAVDVDTVASTIAEQLEKLNFSQMGASEATWKDDFESDISESDISDFEIYASDFSASEVDESDADCVMCHSTPATSLSSSPTQSNLGLVQQNPTLHYQVQANGPVLRVPESVLPSVLDESGWNQLKAVFNDDCMVERKYPHICDNGIHVFLDMSNIHISYLQMLKTKFKIPSTARFTRNPIFDIEILTDLIVRSRTVRTLRAGCSVMPGRPEPAFIKTLRGLNYQVDVRERRPTQEPKASTSHEGLSTNNIRYVEDLVDETIQTRIGEVFMDNPEKKGTLILVTGDGKPAKFSDGFYKYACRALKWGWHVEVVCWSACCSSLWRDLAADESMGHRFRLIELDGWLDHLWLKKN